MLFAPLVLAMFVAGGISGMTGFGVGVVGSISLAIITGPKQAVILLSVLSSFAAAAQVVKFWRNLPAAGRIVPLLAGALIGAAAGSYLLLWLSYTVLATMLGVLTLTYVVVSLTGLRPRVGPAAERLLSPGVGLLAGMVNSTVGSSGPVLGPYMLALGLSPAAFVAALSVAFLVMGLVRVIALAVLQAYTWPVVAAGLGLVLPTFGGQLVGFWLQKRVSRRAFERLVLAMLSIAACYLLYRAAASAL